ncbi:MAG: ATP-binding cassette domain-containing protein [Rhodovibrionaceae bacterium]|nr:ATP-binding cassette domain-containing protein [Rhodovibrionaceae bacterium]
MSAALENHNNDGGAPSGAEAETVIRISGLVTRFGRQLVHDGVDLEVRRGEVMAMVGGSGSGKSVLLRTAVGLLRPAEGSIEVLGVPLDRAGRSGWRELERRWGVLFQSGALFSSLTVVENVELPLKEHTDMPAPLRREIALLKLGLVGLPQDSAGKYPAEISGGMRKRAGLARALVHDPELLFLDEPTAGLDPVGAAAFDTLVRDLQRNLGLSVLMVTHDLDTLVAVADRIAVLVDKRVKVGTMDRLAADQHPWIQDYFNGPRGRAARHDAEGQAESKAGPHTNAVDGEGTE